MRLRTLALGLSALLALSVAGVVAVLPEMLDWNRFRPEIAALASDVLGREIHIGGAVRLAVLPELTLTADEVSFAGDGGGMTAHELRLHVTLAGLLAGRIEARELVLRGIDLHLPWPLPASALAIRTPHWLGSISARIEKSRVRIGNLVLSNVEATLATAETTGTWQVQGTGTAGGQNGRFSVQLSQPGGDGASGLDFAFDGMGPLAGVGARVSGQVGEAGGFAGRMGVWARDLSSVMAAPAVPLRLEGRITVAEGLAAADDLAGDIGGVALRTSAALRLSPAPRLDLAMTMARLDIDAWRAALGRRGVVPALGGLVVGLDVSAEVAQVAGGAVRSLRAAFDVGTGGVEVREVRATLPGDAGLVASGRLGVPAVGGTAGFDGVFTLGTANPRALVAWLAPEIAAVMPDGVLRRAALAGRVNLAAGGVTLDGLGGSIDDMTLDGAATLRLGARPGVKLAGKLGRVELTRWLARGGIAGLAGWDGELRLEAAEVVTAEAVLSDVVLDGTAEAGRIVLRRFEAGVGPSRLTASGIWGDGRVSDLAVSVAVPPEGLSVALRAGWVPGWILDMVPQGAAFWRVPLRLDVTGGGSPAAFTARLVGQAGDLRIEASPTIDIASGKWSGSIAARHPGAPRLLESLGITGTPNWLGDGSFGLVAQVQGDSGRVAADALDLTAGALHVTGTLAAAGQRVSGKLDFETLPLPLPFLRGTQPLPWIGLGGSEGSVQIRAQQVLVGLSPGLDEMRGALGWGGGGVRIEGVTARLAGGAIAGRAEFDTTALPPVLTLDAKLDGAAPEGRVFDLPLDLEGGRIDGSLKVTASGSSPGALLATMTGEGRFSAVEGILHGVALGGLVAPFEPGAIAAALAGGASRFGRMEVVIGFDRGSAVLQSAMLAGPEGEIAASGAVDLPAARLELRFDITPAVADPPRLGLRLSGPLKSPARAGETADLLRWQAAHPP